MRVIYVAAPYRAKSIYERDLNVSAARYAGYKLAKLGFFPFMPTINTHGFDAIQGDHFWLSGTMEMLRRCNAVYVVDGSESSAGVQLEIKEAKRLNIPVFYSMDILRVTLGAG